MNVTLRFNLDNSATILSRDQEAYTSANIFKVLNWLLLNECRVVETIRIAPVVPD
jgi:hypothetical protein